MNAAHAPIFDFLVHIMLVRRSKTLIFLYFQKLRYLTSAFTRPAFMEIMELAEQGLVENLVVKDHSRLGRNRLVVGQLLEEDFVRLNVRYIAIMDNIDTANGVSNIVPMQDLFNEWHAEPWQRRDTTHHKFPLWL